MDLTALHETILAQYANSPTLLAFIDTFNQAASADAFTESVFANIWNLPTATGWGLDVWGRIVGIDRIVKTPRPDYVGFDEANDGTGTARPLDDGIFYNGTTITDNYRLPDDAYRTVIMAKAAANISNGSIADINRLLMQLFGNKGRIFLAEGINSYLGFAEQNTANESHPVQPIDHGIFWADTSLGGGSMTMTICHDWDLSPLEATIIQAAILPRPSGVSVAYQRV